MARINIEDSIYKDDRFINLILKLGNKHTALGMMVSAWTLAQKHYLNETNDRSIPLNEWEQSGLNLVLEVGLAEKQKNGVYVKGSEEQFKWLHQRAEAGRKSAKNRDKKLKSKGKLENERSLNETERQPTDATPLSLTLSPTLPLSLSQSSFSEKVPAEKNLAGTELNRRIWFSYREAYMAKYGVEPARNATVNSQIKSLGQKLGEEAVEVVKFYLKSNNSYYIRKSHDIAACLTDYATLRTQWLRNREITSADIKDFERAQQFQNTMRRIEEEGV